jgi:hypothetical protein
MATTRTMATTTACRSAPRCSARYCPLPRRVEDDRRASPCADEAGTHAPLPYGLPTRNGAGAGRRSARQPRRAVESAEGLRHGEQDHHHAGRQYRPHRRLDTRRPRLRSGDDHREHAAHGQDPPHQRRTSGDLPSRRNFIPARERTQTTRARPPFRHRIIVYRSLRRHLQQLRRRTDPSLSQSFGIFPCYQVKRP